MFESGKVIFAAVSPSVTRFLFTWGLVLSAGVMISAAGPAQADHKGVPHGGGGSGGEIQTLESLDCSTGEIAKFDGTVWSCEPDANTNAATECESGEYLDGSDGCQPIPVDTTIPNSDALGDLNCTIDQIALFDGIDWVCADDPTLALDEFFASHPKLVFVTSEVFALTEIGQGQADAHCQRLADAAGFRREFKAWLSDPTAPGPEFHDGTPNERFKRSTLFPYALVDGTVVANDYADLISDGPLSAPINMDETGGIYDDLLWTGTGPDGTNNAGGNCQDFTDFSDQSSIVIGFSLVVDDTWSARNEAPCGTAVPLPVYCFEQ